MKRVGIIGCGRIAEQGHLPGYAELAGRIAVVAVADPAAERRDLLGDRFQIPPDSRYAEYRNLLARDDLDYVDICLPHHLHHAATIAAAEAGHNILLEKPLAANEDEALAMIAAVEKAGVVFSLIHNYSRQRVPSRVLELVHAGAIGTPYLVRFEGFGNYHYQGTAAYDPGWRAKAGRGGGGALLDNGYHSIYLARYLMQSEVREVFGAWAPLRAISRWKTPLLPYCVTKTAPSPRFKTAGVRTGARRAVKSRARKGRSCLAAAAQIAQSNFGRATIAITRSLSPVRLMPLPASSAHSATRWMAKGRCRPRPRTV